MPTFPTYHGEMPECLNPLKPRHYFLLLYWVFFRPSGLKHYLHQADPELYRTGKGKAIFHTWNIPSYRNPLFGSVTGIPVSFLNEGAARRLITQPNADFDLDYDPDAIETIIGLTHGQPYLIQLICHSLVSRFNRQMFEEELSGGSKPERRFHLADVEAVVSAPELFRDGDAYFSGVWQQASDGESAEQHTLLRILAVAEQGLSAEELMARSGLSQVVVQQALKVLERHDVLAERDGIWRFTVELMRRWVARSGGSHKNIA